jgi:phage baseplate assembly protein W
MTHFGFPYRMTEAGRTAGATHEQHVRELVELVLFTDPGSRVNRPEFGSGARRLVFAGNSPELATATEFLVQGALQRWLGDLLQVESLTVTANEATLAIDLAYRLIETGERGRITVTRES